MNVKSTTNREHTSETFENEDPHRGAVGLRALSKSFAAQSRPAVDSIDLSIRPGEFMTLLGPSGSGKSTTLNMIAGFEAPTTGTIEINGSDVSSLVPQKRGIGMVFQNYALFPHMTVIDNVMFPLRRRGYKRQAAQRSARHTLNMVGLDSHENRYPSQLSGGQQQRVAFARAVVFEPSVLLLDEPFGALDKTLRQHLQKEVARIHSELGATFVFVTHDQDEALALSDRIALFKDGQIEQVGSPRDLYQKPQSKFVAEFIGESNMLGGEVKGSGSHAVLDTPDGSFALPASTQPRADPGHLMIRPERMRVAFDAPQIAGNAIAATVSHSVFQGTYIRVEGETPSGTSLVAFETERMGNLPSNGDLVNFFWHADDAYLLP